MAMDRSWFDLRFLARLEQLAMLSRKTFAGRTAGLRRSLKRGQGAEFDDYRNYVQGDDLRYLDWNLYGRLERLFLKISLQEEDLQVHLLIDSSRSILLLTNSPSTTVKNPTKSCIAAKMFSALQL